MHRRPGCWESRVACSLANHLSSHAHWHSLYEAYFCHRRRVHTHARPQREQGKKDEKGEVMWHSS